MTATRLYEQFKPDHYDLYLAISRKEKTIEGKTTVTGQALSSTIRLNQKHLTITAVQLDGKDLPFTTLEDKEAVEISEVPVGEVTLTLDYHAKLTDPMMGIYPCYYQVDGVKKQLVATQFETTFARQAFPCVDEPEAKATFSLAVKFDEAEGETVLANEPEERCEDGVHYFKKTVRMSTYLVAFVFGDLQGKKVKTTSGVEIGVFATKAHPAKNLDFALDIAKRAIEFYEDFYQTPYPLPQSYQVALPDFSAGAMENWGLVTYREAYLLVDPDNDSLSTKQRVATVITHELAHQWFGDLVTMKWWDDLWLNESFANMMEYVAVDALEPDWKVWEVFQTSDVPAALHRDATAGVQSVHVMVNDPREIDALFDGAIVYAKGARLLVMVRSLVGDEALRKGLKAYFAKHQYGNATGPDLWKFLGEASHLNIGEIMENWLEKPGYPVVSVRLEDDRLNISQEPFYIGEKGEMDKTWHVPLHSNYKEVPLLLEGKELVLDKYADLRAANGRAFRLNDTNSAHYIVNYDEGLLKDILKDLTEESALTQLQVLQDMFLLARAGYRQLADLLPVLEALKDSPSSIVQSMIYDASRSLKKFVEEGSKEEKQLKAFIGRLAAPTLSKLGLVPREDDTNDEGLARPYGIAQSLYAGDKATIEGLHALYQEHADDPSTLPASVRSLVLQNEVKNYGTPALYEDLFKAYKDSSNASYKSNLQVALGQSKDEAFIDRLLAAFKDSEWVKPQDLRFWYSNVLSTPHAKAKAWKWLKDEWQWLEATVGGDMEFSTFITVTANIFHTAEDLEEFKAFFLPKKDVPGLGREIEMDVRLVESSVAFIAANKAEVLRYLEKA